MLMIFKEGGTKGLFRGENEAGQDLLFVVKI